MKKEKERETKSVKIEAHNGHTLFHFSREK